MNIEKQETWVNQIKLCFDFEFNPALFIADSKAVNAKYQSNEIRDVAGQRDSEKDLSQRLPRNTLVWSKIDHRGGSLIAEEHAYRSGLWILKADRVTGIDVQLSKSGESVGHVLSKKVKTDYGWVWDLQMTIAGWNRKGFFK